MKHSSDRIWMAAVSVFVLTVLIFYFAGFRITTSPLSIVKTSTIDVISPFAGATVLVGDEIKGWTKETGTLFRIKNLVPGQYAVILSKNDYWPWAKPLEISSNSHITVYPFILPQESSTTEIRWNDPEYESINAKFYSEAKNTATSTDKTAVLTVTNNLTVTLTWTATTTEESLCNTSECSKTNTVIQSVEQVRAVDFLGNRNDVIIFAAGNGIFALEADKRGIQNFQPLYRGTEPIFVSNPDKTELFILDNGKILSLKIGL